MKGIMKVCVNLGGKNNCIPMFATRNAFLLIFSTLGDNNTLLACSERFLFTALMDISNAF